MAPWTDDILKIPQALAKKMSRGNPTLADELESVGNLALAQAGATWNAEKGASLKTWVFTRVLWRIRRHLGKEQPECEIAETLVADHGAKPSLEMTEWGADALKRLSPIDRAIVMLRCRGHGEREIAEVMMIARDSVHSHYRRAIGIIRRSRLVVVGRGKAPRSGMSDAAIEGLLGMSDAASRRHRERQSAAAAAANRERAVANRLLGRVVRDAYYFVDHEARRLYGPALHLVDLYRAVAVVSHPIRGAQARRLYAELYSLPAISGREAIGLPECGYRIFPIEALTRRKSC